MLPEQPSPPGNERRSMPRHLRDGEHEGSEKTTLAGVRAEDAAQPRAGWFLWIALAMLAAATAWWVWA